MHRPIRSGLVASLLLALPLATVAQDASPAASPDTGEGTFLFVLSGTSGSVDGDTLTLEGVPTIVTFSDRPERIAVDVPLDALSDAGDAFADDPPNAVLSVLADEGITNVEGLAHHDLIQLLLQTRIPAPRLVDWTDQAILYLHVGTAGATESEDGRGITRGDTLLCLKAFGIRTATDLEQAHWEATHRDELDAFLKILPPAGDGMPPRLSVILDTIRDEEWMANLRYWRDPVHLVEGTVEWPTPVSEAEAEHSEQAAELELDAPNGGNGLPAAATPASRAPAG